MYLHYCTFHGIRCQVLRRLAAGFLLVWALCAGCSRQGSYDLTLDFTGAPAWRYSLDATVRGSITAESVTRAFTSGARCTLLCSVDAKDAKRNNLVRCRVPFARFSSTILDIAELENLALQSREVKLTFDTRNASIAADDTASLPLIRIGEWDVFKDLAKTIPVLPKMRVSPGATWDRERSLPLDIRQGAAVGHLLQSFRLDSIVPGAQGGRVAVVGWHFTYNVEMRGPDASGVLSRMPSSGKGRGTARIDLDRKSLQSASMEFSVAAPASGAYRISWDEDIALNLVH
jgi:hypothetical protein